MEEAKLRNWDKTYSTPPSPSSIGHGTGDGTSNMAVSSTSETVVTSHHRTTRRDMKFWWPQCETIIASLYAYLGTGNEEYLYRHQRISEWTYAHFPDQDYPEWYGYLHRDGTVAQPAKGNIFKGSVPRSTYDDKGLYGSVREIFEDYGIV